MMPLWKIVIDCYKLLLRKYLSNVFESTHCPAHSFALLNKRGAEIKLENEKVGRYYVGGALVEAKAMATLPPGPYIACVEGGGTSFVVALSLLLSPTTILLKAEFPTENPASKTIKNCTDWLSRLPVDYVALGIATFGPIDRATGYITTTPKKGWNNIDVVSPFRNLVRGKVSFIPSPLAF
tara:strand:+ start:137 stop:679 length:543 start_codon:yes stop_codon:yes gene_type:complete